MLNDTILFDFSCIVILPTSCSCWNNDFLLNDDGNDILSPLRYSVSVVIAVDFKLPPTYKLSAKALVSNLYKVATSFGVNNLL